MVFCLLSGLPASALMVDGQPVSDNPFKHELVFSTFPSKGLGELYERILCEAYGRIGYKVAINRVPGRRALILADSGVVDGEAARLAAVEKKCPNLIRVPTSIFRSEMVVFTRDKTIDVSRGWDSLDAYTVGVLSGYKYVETMTEGKERILSSSYESLFKMLEIGRVDIVVLSLFDGLKALKDLQIDNVSTMYPPLADLPVYHYLHIKNEKLVPQINAVLQEMNEEGRLKAIAFELEAEMRAR